MPATDQYWRDLPKMHRLFAWSALALLGATVLMMWKDESREYITYQQEAERLRVEKLRAEIESLTTADYEAQKAQIEADTKAAQEAMTTNQGRLKELDNELRNLKGDSEILARETKSMNAERDKARADYDIAIRDELPEVETTRLRLIFEDFAQRARDYALQLEQTQAKMNERQQEKDGLLSSVTGLEEQLKKVTADERRLDEQLDSLKPEHWFVSFKRSIKSLPIINGFNPIYKIQYDWAQDLEEQLGMVRVARLDRCRSCHVNISEYGAGDVASYPEGEYEQPFCSHPRPDLYLTVTSPHPRDKFACTICHGGDGSGTSFQNAEHSPNDPATAHNWEEEHGWHSNHFWEHPMSPSRFIESNCIRCHHSVTELADSAPKVERGHRLIKQLGCFGCHEMNGYDGIEPIGPDLRLEPQTAEQAAKIAADPNAIAGEMRKVGPSLRHVAAKTTEQFIANWTENPVEFRPTTRMPRFFNLTNQHDALAASLQPVELASIAAFLNAKSQDIELLSPKEGYEPDVDRGKVAFERRGCMACHSHNDEEFAGIKQDFGPELSRVHEKIKPGPEGFNWLYTWIKEPTRHHARTKMPDLKLVPEGEGDGYVDPAADIAAFLLDGGPAQFPELAQPQPYIGVVVAAEFTEEDAKKAGMSAKEFAGVYVTEVLAGSPASRTDQGPLQAGDVITKFNNVGVKSREHLQELETTAPVGDEITLTVVRNGVSGSYKLAVSTPLDDLVRYYLRKSVSQSTMDRILTERRFLVPDSAYESEDAMKSIVKGDEIELVAAAVDEEVSPEVWAERKLQYVGRRTITRYGCYACHDIPQFEGARPIGAGLNDWGRKDTSKLAFEHITEFLHHHGEPDGSSTMERAERAMNDRLKGIDVAEEDLSAAFFVESIEHHGRPGFIWQKLRQPRSYDYRKTETKGWDERLLMPKFNLKDDEIEAIATFVLGLVADPPTPEYQFRPEGPEKDIIEGKQLLAKYNCTGCHMLDVPQVELALDPGGLNAWEIADVDQPAVDRLWKMRPIQEARTGKTTEDGTPIFKFRAHLQQEDRDFGEFSYLIW
ncbi:MAG: c-type cytochrome, partial [Planctomycetaceae bacterium]|nr:c-type cytochrome [Planctomycetaceae bacterium]